MDPEPRWRRIVRGVRVELEHPADRAFRGAVHDRTPGRRHRRGARPTCCGAAVGEPRRPRLQPRTWARASRWSGMRRRRSAACRRGEVRSRDRDRRRRRRIHRDRDVGGSTAVTGWRGTDTRYASASSATARWTPELPDAGGYDVYAWVPPRDANSAAASYTVVSNAGGTESRPSTVRRRRAVGAARQLRLRRRQRRVRRTRQGLRRDRADARRCGEVHRGRAVCRRASGATGLEVDVERTPPIGDNWFIAQWEGVDDPDAVGYHVYLDGQRLTWQPVQRTTFDFHELLGGETYEIQVTAVDRLGNESGLSTAVDAVVPRDKHAPRAPSGWSAEAANGTAVLYWDQNSELDLGGYNVYADGELITPCPSGTRTTRTTVTSASAVPDLANGVVHTIEIRRSTSSATSRSPRR